MAVAVGAVAAVGIGACGGSQRADEPVTEAEATEALDRIVALAAPRTPDAMEELCDVALDDCAGFSGGLMLNRARAACDEG